MIAQANNFSSLKIKANQSSRSTLTKYVQVVAIPCETPNETLVIGYRPTTLIYSPFGGFVLLDSHSGLNRFITYLIELDIFVKSWMH